MHPKVWNSHNLPYLPFAQITCWRLAKSSNARVPRETHKCARSNSLTALQQNILVAFATGLIPATAAQRDYEVTCNANNQILQAPKDAVDRLINAMPNDVPYPLDGEHDSGSGGHSGGHSFGATASGSRISLGVVPTCDYCGYSAFGDEIQAMARQGFEECVDSGLNDAGNGRFFNYRVTNGYYTVQVGGGSTMGTMGLAGTYHAVSI
jgi:hypothetical protein